MTEITLHTTITKRESDATLDPKIETLREIAGVLNIGVDGLLK